MIYLYTICILYIYLYIHIHKCVPIHTHTHMNVSTSIPLLYIQSFTNNSNVPIDVIIFTENTFYSDQLTIDVETGIVTK